MLLSSECRPIVTRGDDDRFMLSLACLNHKLLAFHEAVVFHVLDDGARIGSRPCLEVTHKVEGCPKVWVISKVSAAALQLGLSQGLGCRIPAQVPLEELLEDYRRGTDRRRP